MQFQPSRSAARCSQTAQCRPSAGRGCCAKRCRSTAPVRFDYSASGTAPNGLPWHSFRSPSPTDPAASRLRAPVVLPTSAKPSPRLVPAPYSALKSVLPSATAPPQTSKLPFPHTSCELLPSRVGRSEEHTSELQSLRHL